MELKQFDVMLEAVLAHNTGVRTKQHMTAAYALETQPLYLYNITKDGLVFNLTHPRIKPTVDFPSRRHPLGVHGRPSNA